MSLSKPKKENRPRRPKAGAKQSAGTSKSNTLGVPESPEAMPPAMPPAAPPAQVESFLVCCLCAFFFPQGRACSLVGWGHSVGLGRVESEHEKALLGTDLALVLSAMAG